MRTILHPKLSQGRIRTGFHRSTDAWGCSGAFEVVGPTGPTLRIIASDAKHDPDLTQGWEHVSVSLPNRCPNWPEMSFVKDLFWDEDETVIQLHPPKSQYISNHPYCLHLWRDSANGHAMPPPILVGVKDAGELKTPEQARALRKRILGELT